MIGCWSKFKMSAASLSLTVWLVRTVWKPSTIKCNQRKQGCVSRSFSSLVVREVLRALAHHALELPARAGRTIAKGSVYVGGFPMLSSFVLMMLGRTGAGKTTLARKLVALLDLDFHATADIKEELVQNFSNTDCLNDCLRDEAYRIAIARTRESLIQGRSVVVDASFHRRSRREQLYTGLTGVCRALCLLYCHCPSFEETERRIVQRAFKNDGADHHACTMDVYHHINQGFQEPTREELPATTPAMLIRVNTVDGIYRIDKSITGSHEGLNREFLDCIGKTLAAPARAHAALYC